MWPDQKPGSHRHETGRLHATLVVDVRYHRRVVYAVSPFDLLQKGLQAQEHCLQLQKIYVAAPPQRSPLNVSGLVVSTRRLLEDSLWTL